MPAAAAAQPYLQSRSRRRPFHPSHVAVWLGDLAWTGTDSLAAAVFRMESGAMHNPSHAKLSMVGWALVVGTILGLSYGLLLVWFIRQAYFAF